MLWLRYVQVDNCNVTTLSGGIVLDFGGVEGGAAVGQAGGY